MAPDNMTLIPTSSRSKYRCISARRNQRVVPSTTGTCDQHLGGEGSANRAPLESQSSKGDQDGPVGERRRKLEDIDHKNKSGRQWELTERVPSLTGRAVSLRKGTPQI